MSEDIVADALENTTNMALRTRDAIIDLLKKQVAVANDPKLVDTTKDLLLAADDLYQSLHTLRVNWDRKDTGEQP